MISTTFTRTIVLTKITTTTIETIATIKTRTKLYQTRTAKKESIKTTRLEQHRH